MPRAEIGTGRRPRSGLGRLAFAVGLAVAVAGCDDAGTQSSTAPASTTPAEAHTPFAQTAKPRASVPIGNGFDFYVLSLSWSPSYCEAEGEDANRQQCGTGRPYAFLVHGLWPQFEQGWPENCPTDDGYVSDEIVASLRDIMPSAGLIGYQWRKHGSCSGLDQADYFKVLRAARERTVVPSEYRKLDSYLSVPPGDVEKAFLASNSGLDAKGIAITCDDRYLREVRLCMTKDLALRTCPEVDRRACTLPKAVMPPVRGK